ncbi:MAG: M55 family metallopeptidase [bacterium]|nr:M55 family metallopeptidase [Candidatus Sumerlaeota bacterium]
MRVVLLCDMEGSSCVTQWDQVNSDAAQYAEGRRLYTQDVNAAVRGAKRAGAKEIIVVDGHGAGGAWSFNSLVKDMLEPGAEYVFGHRWGCYVEPLKAGCDAMLMIATHAMAGTSDGILCHTISSQSWHEAFINGRPIGESALAAGVAGAFDVPLVLVSGDEAACREARAIIGPQVAAAPVKRGTMRYTARCLAPADSAALIENTVCQTLTNPHSWPKPLVFEAPMELRVEMSSPDKTRDFIGKPGVEITGPRTVVSRGENFWRVWDQFWHQ